SERRVALQRAWSETSYRMQALRDHPACAQQEFDTLLNDDDPGLHVLGDEGDNEIDNDIDYELDNKVENNPSSSFFIAGIAKPRVAILREQGVNGHVEMAAAFFRAGFESIDVHM